MDEQKLVQGIGHDTKQNCDVSVIMPVYNIGHKTDRAISSIKNQDINDWELIIVNDGSTDDTEKIIKEKIGNDARIKFETIQHSGVSNARNYGLSLARGEYVFFLDGDDYISNNYLHDLVLTARKYDADIVSGSWCIVEVRNTAGKVRQYERRFIYDDRCLNLDTLVDDGFIKEYKFLMGLSKKLYRRDLLEEHKLYFPEYILSEDVIFHLNALFYANKYASSKSLGYYYIHTTNEKKYISDEPFEDMMEDVVKSKIRLYKKHIKNKKILRRELLYIMSFSIKDCIRAYSVPYIMIPELERVREKKWVLSGLNSLVNQRHCGVNLWNFYKRRYRLCVWLARIRWGCWWVKQQLIRYMTCLNHNIWHGGSA